MANYFNIWAGIMTFIGCSVIVYGLWNPVMNVINLMPIELFVIVGSTWVTYCFFCIVYMPFVMMVSDDSGR